MTKMGWMMAGILACLAVSCLALPALAYEKEIKQGDAAWVLSGLGADKATVTITNLDPIYSTCRVSAVYANQGNQASSPSLVNVVGPRSAVLTFSRPGDRVTVISISCSRGQVKALVECEGRGY